MGTERILKNTFLLKVTTLEKIEDKDGKTNLKVIDSKWVKTSAREFEESYYFDRAEGISHLIKIVAAAPEEFQIGTTYIRADGKQAYVYVIKE